MKQFLVTLPAVQAERYYTYQTLVVAASPSAGIQCEICRAPFYQDEGPNALAPAAASSTGILSAFADGLCLGLNAAIAARQHVNATLSIVPSHYAMYFLVCENWRRRLRLLRTLPVLSQGHEQQVVQGFAGCM
jgi:hypothetical protein